MTPSVVYNCKKLGIRKDPTITEIAEEVVSELSPGDPIDVDYNRIYWSWDDKQFYKVSIGSIEGYAITSCVKPKRGAI